MSENSTEIGYTLTTDITPMIPLMITIDTNKGLTPNVFSIKISTNGEDVGYIDWGDNNITSTSFISETTISHTYNNNDIYQLRIYGGINHISFEDLTTNDNNLKIISLDRWGTHPYIRICFKDCINMVAKYKDFLVIDQTTLFDASNMFDNCINFDGQTHRFRGKIGSIYAAFKNAKKFNSDISKLDISNCMDFASTFEGTEEFNQPLNGWNVSNAVIMNSTFADSVFDQDISNWDVSNVIDMSDMFTNGKLSTKNYDALLVGWTRWDSVNGIPNRILQDSVNFGVGDTKYSSNSVAETVRNYLTTIKDWNIFDGGSRAPYLLNEHPNNYGESWTLYRVNSNFISNIIEIQRDDGDKQSYMFDSGELPIGAISSFAGSGGNAKIRQWIGQANGNIVIQTDWDHQPWLIKDGTPIMESGHLALYFENDHWLDGGNILNPRDRNFVSLAVYNMTNPGGLISPFRPTIYSKTKRQNIPSRYAIRLDYQQWQGKSTVSDLHVALGEGQQIMNQTAVGNIHRIYKNNTLMSQLTNASTIDTSPDNFQIGGYVDIYFPNGTISDIHIFLENKMSVLSDINDMINDRYNIYP